MLAVVVSRADEASEHIGDHLLELTEWDEHEDRRRSDRAGGGVYYRTDGAELRTFDDLHLHLDGAAAAFDDPELHDVSLSGTAVVVGAGGAGRAAAFALADEGMAVRIVNRTVGRADALAREVPNAVSGGLDELETLLSDADVLVNATSVGMESDETPVPKEALHADLAVLDAVYKPLDTRLLEDAREIGATTVDGAWMLLFQGVEAFEIWTGVDAPVEVMNGALRDSL